MQHRLSALTLPGTTHWLRAQWHSAGTTSEQTLRQMTVMQLQHDALSDCVSPCSEKHLQAIKLCQDWIVHSSHHPGRKHDASPNFYRQNFPKTTNKSTHYTDECHICWMPFRVIVNHVGFDGMLLLVKKKSNDNHSRLAHPAGTVFPRQVLWLRWSSTSKYSDLSEQNTREQSIYYLCNLIYSLIMWTSLQQWIIQEAPEILRFRTQWWM